MSQENLNRLQKRKLTQSEISTYKYIKANLLQVYGCSCQKCGSTIDLQLDHIKPVFHFPEKTFDINNMQILCKSCNYEKGASNVVDYRTVDEVERFIKYFSESVDLSLIARMPFINRSSFPKRLKKKKKKRNIKTKKKHKIDKERAIFKEKKRIENNTWKPSKEKSAEYRKLMSKNKKIETQEQVDQIEKLKGIL